MLMLVVAEEVAVEVGVVLSQLSNAPRTWAVTAPLSMATTASQPSLCRMNPSIEHSKLDSSVPTLYASTM